MSFLVSRAAEHSLAHPRNQRTFANDPIPIFNVEATRDRILDKIRLVARDVLYIDQVVIWFGGHGHEKLADLANQFVNTVLQCGFVKQDDPDQPAKNHAAEEPSLHT